MCILLKAKITLLSYQAKQRVPLTTLAIRVFHSSFVLKRFLSTLKLVGSSLYGRVVPIAPNWQACSSVNKGTEVK